MKYLFFDLEYATSRNNKHKICEFGFVVTDEKFNILQQYNIIINPNIPRNHWDKIVTKKILHRTIEEYEEHSTFQTYYELIIKLISKADYVIGHTLDSDAKALNDECKRYGLKSIDFDFYDVKILYKLYSNTKKDISLTNILKALNIEGEKNKHDALADSYNTMLAFKTICEKMNVSSFEELLSIYPIPKNSNFNFKIKSHTEKTKIDETKLIEAISNKDNNNNNNLTKINKSLLHVFLINVKPNKEEEKTLNNLHFNLSHKYKVNHFKETLNIIQILTNLGASLVTKLDESDYYVTYDIVDEKGSKEIDLPSKKALVLSEEKKLKIITFHDFLKMINLNEETLSSLERPSLEFIYNDDTIITNKRLRILLHKKENNIKEEKEKKNTLGYLYKDFFDKLKEEIDD